MVGVSVLVGVLVGVGVGVEVVVPVGVAVGVQVDVGVLVGVGEGKIGVIAIMPGDLWTENFDCLLILNKLLGIRII